MVIIAVVSLESRGDRMKWVTREKAKVDRIACPWLITKFIDSDPEFVFLPHDTNWPAITDGTVFDVPNADLGHHGEDCPRGGHAQKRLGWRRGRPRSDR